MIRKICEAIRMQSWNSEKLKWLLVALPFLSFGLQWYLSAEIGTQHLMLRHYNVSVVDFIFVPLNAGLYHSIRWDNGALVFVGMIFAFTASAFTHYNWAITGTDPGHMVLASGLITKAGWIHVLFTGIELSLMLLFFFNGKQEKPKVFLWTALGIMVYLLGSLLGGYLIHRELLMEDALRVALGCAATSLYYLIRRKKSHA